jgi:hypothetical protein
VPDDLSTVDLKLVVEGPPAWLSLAPAASYSMLNGQSGTGLAAIGKPADGTVALHALLDYAVEAVLPATGPAAQSLSSASISTSGGRNVLKWTRPVAAAGNDPQEHALDLDSQGFVWAVGAGTAWGGVHATTGFLTVALRPTSECSRNATCSNRGACPSRYATSCVCDAGYSGAACNACSTSFERNATTGQCVPQPDAPVVKAAVSLRLLLNFSLAGAAGSEARRAFEQAVVADVATALGISTERVVVYSITSGSIVVGMYILPPASGDNNTASAASLAARLQNLAADPFSNLYAGNVTNAVDPSTPVPVAFLPAADTFTHSLQLSPSLTLSWSLLGSSVRMRLTSSAGPWAGVGFNSDPSMTGTDAVVVEPGSGASPVTQYTLQGTARSAVVQVAGSSSTLTGISYSAVPGGGWVAEWSRPLAAGSYAGAKSVPATGTVALVSAWGGAGATTLARHAPGDVLAGYLDLSTGVFSSSTGSRLSMHIAHGIVMFLAWALLAPLGVGASRYMRSVMPTSGPGAFWFRLHRYAQTSAWVLSAVGFGVAIAMVPSGRHFTDPHHILGLIVFLLGFLQPINAYFRPHPAKPGEPTPLPRRAWELLHKGSGYAAVLLACAAIFTGLSAAGAVDGLTAAYAAVLAATVGVFAAFEYRRRCVKLPMHAVAGGKPLSSVVTSSSPQLGSSRSLGANGASHPASLHRPAYVMTSPMVDPHPAAQAPPQLDVPPVLVLPSSGASLSSRTLAGKGRVQMRALPVPGASGH